MIFHWKVALNTLNTAQSRAAFFLKSGKLAEWPLGAACVMFGDLRLECAGDVFGLAAYARAGLFCAR
jgi:hypothetical protein